MTFSPLAKGAPLALGFYRENGRSFRRYMDRLDPISGVLFHHGALTSLAVMQAELLKPSRTLSCNYVVGNDGQLHPVVSERFKANTTSHRIDHSRITVETINASLGPAWLISDAAMDMLARFAADAGHRHGFVPSAATVGFHRQYVATACPGPYMWDRRHELIARARAYYDGKTPSRPAPAKPTTPAKPAAPAKKGAALLDGVGIGDSVKISDWMLYDDPALLSGARKVTGTYRITGITYRYRGGEPVLHLQDSRGGKAWAHYSAVDGVVKRAPAPTAPKPAAKTIAQLASEVIAGKHGTGHANRQRSLGVNAATYAKVRAEVNRRVR